MTDTTTSRSTTDYRPDPLIVAGAAWMRARGLKSYQFSVRRVGDHAHVINCMFDMNTLNAIVTPGIDGYTARIETVGDCCTICQPPQLVVTEPLGTDQYGHPITGCDTCDHGCMCDADSAGCEHQVEVSR